MSEHVAHHGSRSSQEGAVSTLLRVVAAGQALYYIATGVWSLVSIDTFQKVTGPKTDLWLVKTVGVLVTVIGAVLGLAARRRWSGPEVPLLGIGSAAVLTVIDVVYVAKRRIAPIYLLDALGEMMLVVGWVLGLQRK
jgi:hypothetical protein